MGRFKIRVRFRVKVSVKDRVRVDPSRCPMHDSPDHRKYDIYKMFICRQFYIFPPLSTVSSPESASFDAFEVFAEIALQFSSRIVEYSSVLPNSLPFHELCRLRLNRPCDSWMSLSQPVNSLPFHELCELRLNRPYDSWTSLSQPVNSLPFHELCKVRLNRPYNSWTSLSQPVNSLPFHELCKLRLNRPYDS